MTKTLSLLAFVAALLIGFGIGCLWMLSRQSYVPIVFNTQPIFAFMSPHLEPIIDMRDEKTIIIHRKPKKGFTVSCLAFTDTSIRPYYENPDCWPNKESGHLFNQGIGEGIPIQ